MPKHKSITQRLRYNLSANVKQDIVNEWAQQKQDAFFDAYKQLEQAIGQNDIAEINIALDNLKDIGIKAFDAMPNIANALLSSPIKNY